MLFSSGVFLMLFLPVTLFFYYIPFTKNISYRNLVLLISSTFFYAWGEPTFFLVMLGSIVVDWILGMLIDQNKNQTKRKYMVIVAASIHVLILFIFKYLTFTTEQLSLLFPIKTIDIALPIGISFFSFQMMSYIFDVYYGKVRAQRSLGKLALYILMFPQLIAGPIVRYQTVVDEINDRKVELNDFYQGVNRFIIGISKKVILADTLGVISDNIFSAQAVLGIPALSAWIGAISFSFQIYFDFSGYSDMAIGLARCFGFHFQENFNYPYIANSVTDFWRRWHISLTCWFRDYVYIPLGGNRVGKGRHIFNLFVVWIFTGIWHGANWTFILWGFSYFVFQIIEKYMKKYLLRFPSIIRWIITMLIVTCNWVLFKCESIQQFLNYMYTMFTGNTKGWFDSTSIYYAQQCFMLFFIGAIACIPWRTVIEYLINRINKPVMQKFTLFLNSIILIVLKDTLLIGMLLLTVACIINGSYSPFIYFNF